MKKYFQAPWTSRDLTKILGITIGGIIIALGILNTLNHTTENTATSFLGSFILQWLLILTPLFIYTKNKYKLSTSIFGLKKVAPGRVIKEILRAYALFISINFIIALFIIYSGVQIPGYQVQENIAQNFSETSAALTIGIIVIMILAPIIEEIFFRGFILRTLVNRIGVHIGSIFTALIFASLHFPWQSFIPIFILGMIMNSMAIRTKSIIPSISFHIVNNIIAFTVQFYASDWITGAKTLFISFT